MRFPVRSDGSDRPSAHRWGGYWYTTFFIDPTEKMISVCMVRLFPSGPATLNDRFEALAHQAIIN